MYKRQGNGSEIEGASKFTVSTPFIMNIGNGAERISDFTFGGATSLSITNVLSMNADKSKGIAKEYLVNYSSVFGKDISVSKKNAYDFSILKDSITLASTAKTEKPEIPKVQLKINPLSGADFFYNGKYNLTTRGAISIKSEDSQSVTIQSVPIDGKEINASMIKLMSSMDTSTSYACQIKVPLASITSMDPLGKTPDTGSGWQITPGISTEYMYIVGAKPGTGGVDGGTGLIVKNEIRCDNDIKLFGDASWYCFYNNAGLWWGDNNNNERFSLNYYEFKEIWDWRKRRSWVEEQIGILYEKVAAAQTAANQGIANAATAQNTASNAATAASNAQTTATNADNKADANSKSITQLYNHYHHDADNKKTSGPRFT